MSEENALCPQCEKLPIVQKPAFSFGAGIVGLFILGPVGLLCGVIGNNTLTLICFNCGHRWEKPWKTNSEIFCLGVGLIVAAVIWWLIVSAITSK